MYFYTKGESITRPNPDELCVAASRLRVLTTHPESMRTYEQVKKLSETVAGDLWTVARSKSTGETQDVDAQNYAPGSVQHMGIWAVSEYNRGSILTVGIDNNQFTAVTSKVSDDCDSQGKKIWEVSLPLDGIPQDPFEAVQASLYARMHNYLGSGELQTFAPLDLASGYDPDVYRRFTAGVQAVARAMLSAGSYIGPQ